MTKKLFLAAASVAALAFAGAAQAGAISGHFGAAGGNNNFAAAVPASGGSAAVPAVSYLVAQERVVSATKAIKGTVNATNRLETPIAVGAGAATRDYLVAFTVNGATVLSNSVLNLLADGAPATSATLVSNSAGVVTYLVSVAGGDSVDEFTLVAELEQKAQAPILISSNVVAVIGGSNIPVDSASTVVAAKYAPALKPLSATAKTLEAKLANGTTITEDYIEFASGVSGGDLATAFEVLNDDVNADLNGNDADAAALLDTATLTVKGPLISDHVTVAFTTGMTDANTATTPANTQVFTLTGPQNVTFAAGATKLTINNDGDEEYVAGDYTVTWATKLKSDFTAPAASTADAGTITLEGTNFTAPWVSGTGLATSVIRVSNSNGSASAPVTVRMISGTKVVNGVATPFVSTAAPLVLGSVPANGDLQVNSGQLVAHFGEFTRGDFRITINQDDTGLVAKMRSTRDGQTFEQSLAGK